MKTVVITTICLLAGLQSASVQNRDYKEKKLDVVAKNRMTVLVLSGKEYGLSGNTYGDAIELSRFNLGDDNKVELIMVLEKALSWGSINNAKKLRFQKRVARVNSYFNMDEFSKHIDNSTRYMNVVFIGSEDGSHSIVLYKGYYSINGAIDEFDIEQPGELFWKFDSDQQIRELIATLKKKSPDLDAIFR